MGTSSKMKNEFKFAMSEFEMKYLNLMQYFLGMEVHQSEDKICICHTKYAKDTLKKFDMADWKWDSTPISHGFVLCRDGSAEMADETTYKSIVGSLMFLTHPTPNIAYLISLVSKYMTNL